VPLAEWQHPIQAFLFDRSHEALSAHALQFGEAGGVRTTRTPTALRIPFVAEVQVGSRSPSKMRPSRISGWRVYDDVRSMNLGPIFDNVVESFRISTCLRT
jgi:hypothetical protein